MLSWVCLLLMPTANVSHRDSLYIGNAVIKISYKAAATFISRCSNILFKTTANFI